jgi:hypothetical protein
MILAEVTNDFMADSYLRIYVIVETKEKALEVAREKYEKRGREGKYSSCYWDNLDVQVLSEDTTKPYVGEIES